MQTTKKPPVDLKAIIARANAKKQAVKKEIKKVNKISQEKTPKEKKQKSVTKKELMVTSDTAIMALVNSDNTKKQKIINLHLAGVSNKDIESYLGANQGWIWNVLNAHKKSVADKI